MQGILACVVPTIRYSFVIVHGECLFDDAGGWLAGLGLTTLPKVHQLHDSTMLGLHVASKQHQTQQDKDGDTPY